MTSTSVRNWTIEGAEGQPIIGNAHVPADPRAAVIIAHGFKGYKDYGMFPRLAAELADRGFVAHRFNFSHSGMTERIETFERPDLFERDTWHRQVTDLRRVMEAVDGGALDGGGLPCVVFGHSRGGVTALLTAGRFADDASFPQPAGVATAAAPATCLSLTSEQVQQLLADGYLVSPSSRTGQNLRIGKAYVTEQREDPEAHDVLRQAARIVCPVLVVHGEDDPTVPASAARELGAAIGSRATVHVIPGGAHVFNTPNPMPPGAEPSPQLRQLLELLGDFVEACARGA